MADIDVIITGSIVTGADIHGVAIEIGADATGISTVAISVEDTGSIEAGGDGINIVDLRPAAVVDYTIDNDGEIRATGEGVGQGIDLSGIISSLATVTITNTETGVIFGDDSDAIVAGPNTAVINAGVISGASLDADPTGSDGIDFGVHSGTVINEASGIIAGADHAITGSGSVTITNDGLLWSDSGEAIDFGASAGSIVITNTGYIQGGVTTGSGNDEFNLHTGSYIDGLVNAGGGSDEINLLGSGTGTLLDFAGVETINLVDGDWTLGGEGAAAVAFGSGAQTLRLTSSVLADGSYTGTIDNFLGADVIDLLGIGLATGASLGAGNVLTITGGSSGPITLHLGADENYTGEVFLLSSDGAGGTRITLNEAPVITSAGTFSVAENNAVVGTVTATDGDGDDLTFHIAGGADQMFFAIDENTGQLKFNAAPDFETPEDAGGNNVYNVDVSVTDAFGTSTVQSIAVTVTNVAEAGQVISGGNGSQSIVGSSGSDNINAGNGNDVIDAGDGNDTVAGGNDNDIIYGGRGNDNLDGGNGSDFIDGGIGNDIISAGNDNDTVSGGTGNDNIDGGNGNDSVDGGDGNDVIAGGNGNDVLAGGAGNDNISGGNGNDRITGGTGDDTMSGGNGGDTFAFGTGFGHDIVSDFRSGDLIEFQDNVFADFAAIQLASQQVGTSVVITLDADDTITLQGVQLSSLHASDFVLV